MKAALKIASAVIIVLLLSGGAFVVHVFKQQNLVLPRTVFGDINLSGLTYDEARTRIRDRLAAFSDAPIQIAARGEVAQVTLKELGIVLNEAVVLDGVPFGSNVSNPELIYKSIAGTRVLPNVSVERTELLHAIYDKFPSIPKTKNAHFALVKKKLQVVDAVQGVTPEMDPLILAVKQNINTLQPTPLFVEFKQAPPDILAQDLEENKEQILKLMPQTITLNTDDDNWKIDFAAHPDWIKIDRTGYPADGDSAPFVLTFDAVAFADFVGKNMSAQLEQAPEGVRIWKDDKGDVQFDGHGSDGRAIQNEELLAAINNAIAANGKEVTVPIATLPAKMEISAELQAMGITDLLSTGYTRFEGSPENRAFNIGVAIKRFNGVLIAPGEVFSFGKTLGLVDGSTGYRKELVIKPEGTIPEYGGGVCQVSSTMYRAALFAGLPVVERKPHSYAVSYYAQVGGHGLDATVYPPSPDLKFKNDTPNYILVQSYKDGPSATFKFYGTKDGRSVKMEGPFISNKRGAPSEPLLVPDPKLAPGTRKQVEKAHGGFDALWYRNLTLPDGTTKKESIVSKYEAVPDKFLVGGEPTPPGLDANGIDTQPNPFE